MNPDWKLPANSSDWEATWEASRRFQIRHWAALPFERKLAALEEMNDYARNAAIRHKARTLREKRVTD
jgi:hypothetical protein